MTDKVERIFRPNNSLTNMILAAMREQGHGLGERLVMSLRLRVMSQDKRLELEQAISAKLFQDVESGLVSLPVTSAIEGGVYVGDWRDLFEWFMANWPAILEMILAIIALFALDLISASMAIYQISQLLESAF